MYVPQSYVPQSPVFTGSLAVDSGSVSGRILNPVSSQEKQEQEQYLEMTYFLESLEFSSLRRLRLPWED